ncbi:nucleotidyltransferase domain-containing protein [Streptococcus merionis]|uniref:nucleotidyltransferase domain-containing protein n=1 Tax=Streptococcus merionis TaxID=400065 RepID=UPI003518F0F5
MFSKTHEDIIYLLRYYLQRKPISHDIIAKMNLENLAQFSQFHSLSAMVAMILEDYIELPKELQEAKNQGIRRELLFDHERQKITKWLSRSGIWYMELKGILLKTYYPKLGMREMSDNDILFDESFQKEVKHFFTEEGYSFTYEINVDAYMKKPIFHFEMHRKLIDPLSRIDSDYYDDVKSRLLPDQDRPFAYHFSLEDFYLYQTLHDYKHYSQSGTGIRSLVDLFLFLETEYDNLDWRYIKKELFRLSLTDFEQQQRKLAFKLFGAQAVSLTDLTDDDRNVLSYILSSGTYGLMENQIINEVNYSNGNQWLYWKERFFPPVKTMQLRFPTLQKHRYLLPLFYLYRFIPTPKRWRNFSLAVCLLSRKKEK